MYVNGKMRPVETTPGMGVGEKEIGEDDEECEFSCEIL
jgi:hypothetical protein